MRARSQLRQGGRKFNYVGNSFWVVPQIMINIAEEIQKPEVLVPGVGFEGIHKPPTQAEAKIECGKQCEAFSRGTAKQLIPRTMSALKLRSPRKLSRRKTR